jgi:histidine triad (HIT) family protein
MRGERRRNVGAMARTAFDPTPREGLDPACSFCRVVEGGEPSHEVWRDEVAVAFLDRSPLFPGHALVVPTRHAVVITDLRADEVGAFFERVQRVAGAMLDALGADGTFVANNNIVSQSVGHLHVHVVPRRRGDGLRGFFWPRQRYRPGEAEEVAARLRSVLP